MREQDIVIIGGGHGPARLIEGFMSIGYKNVTAVVAVTDSGGHSGKLRRTRGGPALGDLRRVISACIPNEYGLQKHHLEHRLKKIPGSDLNDAVLGNLALLTCLERNNGNLYVAIKEMQQIYHSQYTVLPVSQEDVQLCVKRSDGITLEGEGLIDTQPHASSIRIRSAWLNPKAKIFSVTKERILEAKAIVISPGSLWTSIIPCLLVDGVRQAINKSGAKLFMVMNLMTVCNETKGYNASKFAQTQLKHLNRKGFDCIIANNGEIQAKNMLEEYRKTGSEPVVLDPELCKYADSIIETDLVENFGERIRHGNHTAQIILDLCR